MTFSQILAFFLFIKHVELFPEMNKMIIMIDVTPCISLAFLKCTEIIRVPKLDGNTEIDALVMSNICCLI